MKKTVSIILSIIMVLTMIAALSGCSGSKEQEKFLGTWRGDLDMTDYINQVVSQDEEMAEYLKVSNFALVMEMTFNKDGTYKATVDENAAKEALEVLQKDYADGIYRYFEDYIAEAGIDMSVDEVISAAGVNIDELVKESFGEESFSAMISEASSEGKYEVKDGKLYMSDGLDAAINKNSYETYELSGEVLTILASSDPDNNDTGMYPMTFKKVA